MRFSIIIPTFNRAGLLDQAIQSALAQSHADREILVVDDGSSDDSASVAAKYDSAVGYVRQDNRGKAAAINLGLAHCKGDAILVLDDDDLLPSSAIARHAEALAGNSGADFSYGRYLRFTGAVWPSLADLKDEEPVPTGDPRRLVVKLMERCFISNPTWAVRRQAQLAAGQYDERLHRSQDFDMILRLARRDEGVYIDDVVHLQRTHASARGPTAERIHAVHTVDQWLKYDALIFAMIDQEWSLGEFRPLSYPCSAAGDENAALLQKGVILFQRKVYEGARRALSQYRQRLAGAAPTPLELKIASGLLGCRYGLADLTEGAPSGDGVAEWLRAGRWPLSMRAAFASQIRWRLKEALFDRRLSDGVALISFSQQAFGLATTAAILGSRYSGGGAAWRSARNLRVDLSETLLRRA
jgi:hypothetical protein